MQIPRPRLAPSEASDDEPESEAAEGRRQAAWGASGLLGEARWKGSGASLAAAPLSGEPLSGDPLSGAGACGACGAGAMTCAFARATGEVLKKHGAMGDASPAQGAYGWPAWPP
mmetsp:Transcript_8151/g.24202  ORF Transcript_8151/g.24202 Transcript_8151/m.24202 type:complete len:114 (-) Transcript_8151:7-348(-)